MRALDRDLGVDVDAGPQGVEDDAVALGAAEQRCARFATLVVGDRDGGAAADRADPDGNSRPSRGCRAHPSLPRRRCPRGDLDAHVRRDHPQRDLLAGGERAEQQVAAAGDVVVAADRPDGRRSAT
jgi:hypothetical protein